MATMIQVRSFSGLFVRALLLVFGDSFGVSYAGVVNAQQVSLDYADEMQGHTSRRSFADSMDLCGL